MLRVRAERLRRQWPQIVLAYHAELTTAEISLIERGRLAPSAHQLDRLSRALEIPIEALLVEVPDTEVLELEARSR